MKNTNLKKIITLAVLTLGLALIPNRSALALSASLSCSPTTISPGEVSKCSASADVTGNDLIGLQAYISVDGNLTLGNIGRMNGWGEIMVDNGNLALAVSGPALTGKNIAFTSFEVKAGLIDGQNGTVSIKNISYSHSSETSTKITNPATITISVVAPKKADETVIPGSGETKPGPTEAKKETEPTKPNTSGSTTTARPTTTAPTISNPGKSGNTYLSSLSLSSGDIDFDKDTTEYSLSVPYDVTDIEVMTVVDDDKSAVTVLGNTDLAVGENTITILVTSENGATRTYTLIVTREVKGAPVLKTTEPEIEEASLAAVFGVIFLSLLGLGATIFFIFFIIKRKKDKEDNPTVDPYDEMPAQEVQKETPIPDYTNTQNTKARYSDSTTSTVDPIDFEFKQQNNPPKDSITKENIEDEDLSEETPPQDSYYQ